MSPIVPKELFPDNGVAKARVLSQDASDRTRARLSKFVLRMAIGKGKSLTPSCVCSAVSRDTIRMRVALGDCHSWIMACCRAR